MKFRRDQRSASTPPEQPAPPQGLDLRAGMPSRDTRKAKAAAVWQRIAAKHGWTAGEEA